MYEHTNKGNCVAIVTDGTRVLGLGDIGPEAALPVMEGKALLFKYLGGVDAVPICLGTKDPDEFVWTVQYLEPSFGGINLEDIAQPKCFRILDQLRAAMNLPVGHDDQQGSATVLLAALLNALKVVGKELGQIRIAMIGVGAANVSVYRLLKASGVNPLGVVASDAAHRPSGRHGTTRPHHGRVVRRGLETHRPSARRDPRVDGLRRDCVRSGLKRSFGRHFFQLPCRGLW